jgi:hypothetical protein
MTRREHGVDVVVRGGEGWELPKECNTPVL